jgi:UDP-glucose 4-epimerase
VHVDDVAEALALAVTNDLHGAYNVAADGWLAMDEVCGILGRGRLNVPEGWAFGAVASLWDRGLWTGPPGLLHFLMHPWVLATARLRGAGWAPRRSNREVLREFAAERSGWVRVGPVCVQRRTVAVAAVTSAAVVGGTVWRLRSQRT